MSDDGCAFLFMLCVVVFGCSLGGCGSWILPVVKRVLSSRGLPEKSVHACCVFLMLLAPVTLVMVGLYWVFWWIFYLGVAVKHLLPKRKPKMDKTELPVMRVIDKDKP